MPYPNYFIMTYSNSCIHSLKEKIAQDDQPIRRLKWGTANLIVRAPITPIVLPIVHSGFEKVHGTDMTSC
jgi:hypothetical protein